MNNIQQYIIKPVKEGINFGEDSYSTLLAFSIRVISQALPGLVLGHYLDQGIYLIQKKGILGTSNLLYGSIQIMIWILLFYGMNVFIPSYVSEFQGTLSGVFFITLFFVVQMNFVKNLQAVLGMVDKQNI
jgi:hypothetical protein